MCLIENNKSTTTFEFKLNFKSKGKENKEEKEKVKAMRWVANCLTRPTQDPRPRGPTPIPPRGPVR
jgi:hypothetical protein